MRNLFSILFIVFAFVSCKKDSTIPPVDMGYKYFPVNKGHWIIYDVDSTVWDDFFPLEDPRHDSTYNFQLKEITESIFNDNASRTTERIERYKKIGSLDWYLKNVWFSNLTNSTAEKVENNIRYLKLTFPIRKGLTWNGNIYNTEDKQDYTYKEIHAPYSINGISFDSTLTVVQKVDTNSLIKKEFAIEVYAKNIGLIYKKQFTKETQINGSIVKGLEYTLKIKSWGD